MTRELEIAREALEFAREELRQEMKERQQLEDKRQQRCDEIEQELVDSCLTTLSRDGLRLMSTRTFEVAITGAFPEYQYEVKRTSDDTGSAGVERTLFGALRECAEIIERGARSGAKEEKTVDPWLMLKALGIAIATAVEAELLAQQYGWTRQSCIECRRGMPEVTLQHQGPFLRCVDLKACHQFVREREELKRKKADTEDTGDER